MEHISGHLILLMAPSGSGKGRLVNALRDVADDIYFAKTYTTREKRKGGKENAKYQFISRQEFEKKIKNNEFIEWAEFSGNLYGTPVSEFTVPLAEGKVVLKEMELQGILQIQKIIPTKHITVVYIDAGDWDALKKRVIGRAPISREELEMRRLRYEEESRSKHIADVIISNKDGYADNAEFAFRELIKNIVRNVSK